MTCIIAYTGEDGETWMGADSYSETSGVKHLSADKVRLFGDGRGRFILMGSSGNARFRDVLSKALETAKMSRESDVTGFITNKMPELIRQAANELEYAVSEDGNKLLPGDTLLVAWGGYIFQLDSQYHMARIEENYYAIGTGTKYALGALYTLVGRTEYPIKKRIELALAAAAAFDPYVCEPFQVVEDK